MHILWGLPVLNCSLLGKTPGLSAANLANSLPSPVQQPLHVLEAPASSLEWVTFLVNSLLRHSSTFHSILILFPTNSYINTKSPSDPSAAVAVAATSAAADVPPHRLASLWDVSGSVGGDVGGIWRYGIMVSVDFFWFLMDGYGVAFYEVFVVGYSYRLYNDLVVDWWLGGSSLRFGGNDQQMANCLPLTWVGGLSAKKHCHTRRRNVRSREILIVHSKSGLGSHSYSFLLWRLKLRLLSHQGACISWHCFFASLVSSLASLAMDTRFLRWSKDGIKRSNGQIISKYLNTSQNWVSNIL